MSTVNPAVAHHPIRPSVNHPLSDEDRGRGPRRTGVGGMGETAGRMEVLGNEKAGDEIVEGSHSL